MDSRSLSSSSGMNMNIMNMGNKRRGWRGGIEDLLRASWGKIVPNRGGTSGASGASHARLSSLHSLQGGYIHTPHTHKHTHTPTPTTHHKYPSTIDYHRGPLLTHNYYNTQSNS